MSGLLKGFKLNVESEKPWEAIELFLRQFSDGYMDSLKDMSSQRIIEVQGAAAEMSRIAEKPPKNPYRAFAADIIVACCQYELNRRAPSIPSTPSTPSTGGRP